VKQLLPVLVLMPLLAPLAPLAPPAVAAEPIGRLFYTPDQRSSLDVARGKRGRNAVATEKVEEPAPPTPEVVTYVGMVRRSDGQTTVWLNNKAVTGKESPNAKMVGKIRPDGTVTLQSPQTGRNVDLRVGQRAELLSGRVEEGYRAAPARKPEPKGDLGGAKPAPETTAAAEAERKKEERERQESLDDAIRAMREATTSASAPLPPYVPAPLQETGTPPLRPPAPAQLPTGK